MKGLPGLIQLHQWKVDEQRRKVTELEILSDRLSEQVDQLQADIGREGHNSEESLESSKAYSAFLAGAMAQREKLRGSIVDLGLQISVAKDDLAEAYRELKSYEIAQAARDARERRKQELRDRVKMDEIGMSMHRRKSGTV
jgi:flagellar FliJ protein